MRQRLLVVARSPVDIVRMAGGWMVDQVFVGWEVMVLTEGRADPAMRILGARCHDLECALGSEESGRWPTAVAVDPDLYDSDERIRRVVNAALESGVSDCRFWSDPAAPDEEDAAVRHRLSAAARAFKAQALAALAVPAGPVEGTETFRPVALLHPFGRI